jgi:hypothetical protein
MEVEKKIEQYSEDLIDIGKSEFDIWRLTEKVGRKSCVSIVTVAILNILGLN